MYMNCAVIQIVPKASPQSKRTRSIILDARDTAITNAAAQSALSSYPPLFVANLANINSCKTQETQDVVFDSPGKSVVYADSASRSSTSTFAKGKCVGKGSAASSPKVNDSPSSPEVNDPPTPSSASSNKCTPEDGQWHPDCYAHPASQITLKSPAPAQAQADISSAQSVSPKVEAELSAYLKKLYSSPQRRASPPFCARWSKRSACLRKRGAESVSAADITVQLLALQARVDALLESMEIEKGVVRRDTDTPSLDLFITYLAQLQSTVVECIRGLAAATSASTPTPNTSPKLAPRQLIPPNTALTASLAALQAELARVYALLGQVSPLLSAVPLPSFSSAMPVRTPAPTILLTPAEAELEKIKQWLLPYLLGPGPVVPQGGLVNPAPKGNVTVVGVVNGTVSGVKGSVAGVIGER
jgi:hypothetical protein